MSRAAAMRSIERSRSIAAIGVSTPGGARERRMQIMDAAARVFAVKGFHGATTQDIADVLGIKQASLYYYFPSKEAALETVCLIGAEGFYERAKAIADGRGTAEDKIVALMKSHILPLLDRADYVRVFLNQRQFLPSTSRRKIGRWSRGLERLFERVITEGARDATFRKSIDARLATLALLGTLNAVPRWFDKETRDVDAIVAGLADLALGGLKR